MEIYRAGEDYLKAIYILQMNYGIVRSMDVVRMLNVSKASVSRAIKLLRQGGFLTMDEDKNLFLTPSGSQIAEQIYDKYRVLTSWLVHMGVDAETAQKDSCRMEHVISNISVDVLKEWLRTNYSGSA